MYACMRVLLLWCKIKSLVLCFQIIIFFMYKTFSKRTICISIFFVGELNLTAHPFQYASLIYTPQLRIFHRENGGGGGGAIKKIIGTLGDGSFSKVPNHWPKSSSGPHCGRDDSRWYDRDRAAPLFLNRPRYVCRYVASQGRVCHNVRSVVYCCYYRYRVRARPWPLLLPMWLTVSFILLLA